MEIGVIAINYVSTLYVPQHVGPLTGLPKAAGFPRLVGQAIWVRLSAARRSGPIFCTGPPPLGRFPSCPAGQSRYTNVVSGR